MAHKHYREEKNIKLALFLNLGFTLIEFIGGVLTNSTAIIADAVHDLGDSIALAQAWYFQRLSRRKGNLKYTYGYRRFTLVGAVLSAIVLLMSSFYVLSEAIPRIIKPEHSDAQGMILLALFGVAINGFAMFKLKKEDGANIRVVALHLLEDVLGWIAILIVAVILLFKDIHILDPILAVIITLYVLSNIIKQLKMILPVFLQANPTQEDIQKIEQQMVSLANVDSIHHLHMWSLDENYTILTAHIVSKKPLNSHEYVTLKQEFKDIIKEYGIYHSTLEIEWPKESCRMKENGLCH